MISQKINNREQFRYFRNVGHYDVKMLHFSLKGPTN